MHSHRHPLYIYAHTDTYTQTPTYTHTHMYTRKHTHMHSHIYSTHLLTHTSTHCPCTIASSQSSRLRCCSSPHILFLLNKNGSLLIEITFLLKGQCHQHQAPVTSVRKISTYLQAVPSAPFIGRWCISSVPLEEFWLRSFISRRLNYAS